MYMAVLATCPFPIPPIAPDRVSGSTAAPAGIKNTFRAESAAAEMVAAATAAAAAAVAAALVAGSAKRQGPSWHLD